MTEVETTPAPAQAPKQVQVESKSSLVDALESEDPYAALLQMSNESQQKAERLSLQLQSNLSSFQVDLPELLKRLPNTVDLDSHPVATAIACSDSIFHSLTKIASGGSQASQVIQGLEDEKKELEQHTQDVETALALRQASEDAAQAVSAQRPEVAARAVHTYFTLLSRITDRARAYAGEYTITQLQTSQSSLQTTLLQEYQAAAQQADVVALGRLTPLVQMVQLEPRAVQLYVQFLRSLLDAQLTQALESNNNKSIPPINMAKVYNVAVTILRHHLPMVSHCLWRAKGDAAVLQLVHEMVTQRVEPIFQDYLSTRQLAICSQHAQSIYQKLEDRYVNDALATLSAAEDGGEDDDMMGDAGFSTKVGSLSDVDASLEEAALCLQHAESYTRFVQHSSAEIAKARRLRLAQERQEQERQRRLHSNEYNDNDDVTTNNKNTENDTLETILPTPNPLQELVAEVGGYYSSIERCLLLASMQRAFATATEDADARYFSPLQQTGGKAGRLALQTTLVESSLYAARRGTQRALATGHTGTVSAMANYTADCLRSVLVEYMIHRAEEWGVASLKPGEGLIAGSTGIFQAPHMILRQAGQTHNHAHPTTSASLSSRNAQAKRRLEIEQGLARACATLNDLEVAAHHTAELEHILLQGVEQGFPPNTHETEQLRMCVKSLSPVAEVFRMASNNAMESLVSVLKPRIRAIVTDAVGGETSAGFSSVMGGGKVTDHHTVRMNYDLDEEAYQLLEVAEGYISRLCNCLDEMILPLCSHLAPRLADELVLGVLGTVAKRLEVSLKKCRFTAVGALSLDSDMRDFLNYAKSRLDSNEFNSNMALYKACTPLSRLMQIGKLMNVDDLDDVLDLIRASKRKQTWDLHLEDAKAYLSLRVEFETGRINELLHFSDDE